MARPLLLAIQAGRRILARFVRDEHRQDRIEHRLLLLGIIASSTIAMMPTRQSTMSTAYQTWGIDRNNLWVQPNPAA